MDLSMLIEHPQANWLKKVQLITLLMSIQILRLNKDEAVMMIK